MRCLIIDDDDIQRVLLTEYAGSTGLLDLVKSCRSAMEAVPVLAENSVDLIFLDVVMPKMSGFDFLKTLSPQPQVVIISSHKKYAAEAFELEVADYLVKPISYPRFLKAVNKVKKNLTDHPSVYTGKNTLFVRIGSDIVNIPLKDILWIEAQGDYINIHLPNNSYMVLTSLNEMEQKLGNGNFLRVHRSFIINIEKIRKISGDMLIVSEKLIPISRTHKAKLMRKIEVV